MLFTLRVCLYRQLSSILENHYSSPFYPPPATRLSHSFLCVLSKTCVFTCIRTCISTGLYLEFTEGRLCRSILFIYKILSKVLNTFNKLKLSELLDPTLRKLQEEMWREWLIIPGLYFCLNTNEPIFLPSRCLKARYPRTTGSCA